MKRITLLESIFEEKIIEKFVKLGYEYVDSYSLLEKRGSFSKTIVLPDLESSIRKINKNISDSEVHAIIAKVQTANNGDLITNNNYAFKLMVEGIKIRNKKENITKTFRIIDFNDINNNYFCVTNQFKVSSNNPEYNHQIPDIVVIINGLPISVIELKSPSSENNDVMEKAFNQIKNYQAYISDLFAFNAFNVISNKHSTKMGTITSSFDRYSFWRFRNKTKSNKTNLDQFFEGVFDKYTILNLINNFTFFIKNKKKKTKIIAGYHQYYDVLKAIKSINETFEKKETKAGIFWHTQGSGKSFSMIFLAKQIIKKFRKATILVITDRINLNSQIYNVFSGAYEFLGQSSKKVKTISGLKETLKDIKQNGIFLTNVQKFKKDFGVLSNRRNIFVLADEAHRSHSSTEAELVIDQKDGKLKEKMGNAASLRHSFPNAIFMGFTGTPIEKKDFATRQIFGDYIAEYKMGDATEDGFVVPIYYESRQVSLQLEQKLIKGLDENYLELKEKILENSSVPALILKNLNKKLQKIENIIGDKDRLEHIANDFVEHYMKRREILEGKAIFIAYNRKIAFEYYNLFREKMPKIKDSIRLIMTTDSKDLPEITKAAGSGNDREKAAIEFKDQNSDFKIAIVVDMWMTGFDAPCLDVLYVDKPLKMHNLMQAIARVNRVYTSVDKSITKDFGLVVDYIGIWKKLEDALQFYSVSQHIKKENSSQNILDIKEELFKTLESITKQFFKDVQFTNLKSKTHLWEIIELLQEEIIKKNQIELYINLTKPLGKLLNASISILSSDDKIKTQIIILVRKQLIKRELGFFEIEAESYKLKKKIKEAIIYNKTLIYDEIDNNKISLTSLANFLKSTTSTANKYLDSERRFSAARSLVKEAKKINIIKAERLSNKLNNLLSKYHNGFISIEEFVQGLKFFASEALKLHDEAKEMGFTPEEMAFFEILMDEEYTQNNDYDRKKISEIIKDIFEKLYKTIDHTWFYNESQKQLVKANLYETLIEFGYPPNTSKILRKKLISQLSEQIEYNPNIILKGTKNE